MEIKSNNHFLFVISTLFICRNTVTKLIAKSKSHSLLSSAVAKGNCENAVKSTDGTEAVDLTSANEIRTTAATSTYQSSPGANALPDFLTGGLRRSLTQV